MTRGFTGTGGGVIRVRDRQRIQIEERARVEGERELSERPIKQAQQAHVDILREINRRVKNFYSLPMSDLESFDLSREAPVDHVVDCGPLREGNLNTNETREVDSQVLSAFYNDSKNQFTLSQDGWTRFCKYLWPLLNIKGIVPTVPLYYVLLDRLAYELEAFAPGEIVAGKIPKIKRATVKPQPGDLPNADEYVESLQSNDPRWQQIVDKGWAKEFADWMYDWMKSLKSNFDYDFPVDELGMKAANFIQKWNLPYWRHDTWDKIRVAFVNSGDFPSTMLTAQERLSLLIEQNDMSDYETRREILRRQQELIDNDPRHK